MTREEKNALHDLRRAEDVTIVPADKGKSIVVMDKEEYQDKVSVLLNDTNTYLKITDKRSNLTTSVERNLNKLLLNIREEKNAGTSQIGPELYKKLHCNNSTPASFYGLPKIHKPERPLRPITSSIGSPTYAVSKHLVSILSPLRRNRFSVKNSSEFAQQIRQQTVTSDEIMVSFDVKSLFTSIPVNLALTTTNERLHKDQHLADRANMSISNIMKLLEFVLKQNYFKHDNIYYKQIFGCAMGSPISPVIADLVMEEIEEIAITTARHPPKWWFRYVDDSHACLKKEHVHEFHQHLNSINPSIQFTVELEDTAEQGLPFLDTIATGSGTRIEVNVYRKSTHTDRYLDFNSHHPMCHKRSVVSTLLRRAKNIPSTQEGKRKETKRVKSVLRENNYPSSFINKCERSLSKPPEDLPTNGFVVLPYVQRISEKIGRILRQQEIKVAYKPLKTVNSLFPRPKSQNDVDRPRSGVVYKINCTNCNFVYYGQTERPLKTRITEHKRAVAMFDHDSKISCHVHENNHHMDFNAVSVVGHEPDYHKRLFLEAWLSIKDPHSGNDHAIIPEVYKSLSRA